MPVTPEQVDAGQAVYTKRTLQIYDAWVLGISNRLIWRCPTPRQRAHYDAHVTANHLDVGVGTGYYPDHCRFPSARPRVALMDLNPTALAYAAERIARYTPETYRCNVLEPLTLDIPRFDSVAVNYLLHCLPGDIAVKAVVFDHLRPLLNPGAAVFGTTLLQGDVPRNAAARRLMAVYNAKGIFSNTADTLDGLGQTLEARFRDVQVEVVGCGALFAGKVK